MTLTTGEWESYLELCAAQDVLNRQAAEERYTGAQHDAVSTDWAAWVNGRCIGWRSTMDGALALVRDQVARDGKRVEVAES